MKNILIIDMIANFFFFILHNLFLDIGVLKHGILDILNAKSLFLVVFWFYLVLFWLGLVYQKYFKRYGNFIFFINLGIILFLFAYVGFGYNFDEIDVFYYLFSINLITLLFFSSIYYNNLLKYIRKN